MPTTTLCNAHSISPMPRAYNHHWGETFDCFALRCWAVTLRHTCIIKTSAMAGIPLSNSLAISARPLAHD
eukprot:7720777-Lingulodinium_polyedra.AAC.1